MLNLYLIHLDSGLYLLNFSNLECLLSTLYKCISQLFVGVFLSYLYFYVCSSSLLHDNLNRGRSIGCTKPLFEPAEVKICFQPEPKLGCPYKSPLPNV